MDFNNNKAIYIQIADLICNNILEGKWKGQSRLPSVREIAVELEVNPNTVVRSYNHLQEQNIIYNKRGIGYFVASDGFQTVLETRKRGFLENDLQYLFTQMELLNISFDQVAKLYHTNKQNHEKEQ